MALTTDERLELLETRLEVVAFELVELAALLRDDAAIPPAARDRLVELIAKVGSFFADTP